MGKRIDQERQARLEPLRVINSARAIEAIGYPCSCQDKVINFEFKGNTVTYWPYSGWHSGKTIEDGRGWKHLYDQIKPVNGK